jgi:hypothetical protein
MRNTPYFKGSKGLDPKLSVAMWLAPGVWWEGEEKKEEPKISLTKTPPPK